MDGGPEGVATPPQGAPLRAESGGRADIGGGPGPGRGMPPVLIMAERAESGGREEGVEGGGLRGADVGSDGGRACGCICCCTCG